MRIEHVAMWVNDLEKMRRFYEDAFSASAGERYENPSNGFASYFLSFEDGARLELMQMPGIPQNANAVMKQSTGLIHLAFSTGSAQRVDALTKRLTEAGAPLLSEARMTGDGYYESVVLDPEGNRLEITI